MSETTRIDGLTLRQTRIALGIVVVVAAIVRLTLIGVFPDLQNDEGLWTNSTKNRLLFGDWFMDGRNHFFLSPVFHALSLVPFSLFGPSIESARLVSAVAGVASVPLVYLLAVRLTADRMIGLVAAAIFAVDPWAVIHGRQAMTESVLLFFILASAVFLFGNRRLLVVAGALFALAILTKLNAAAMGLALGGYLLLRSERDGVSATIPDRILDGVLFGVVALGLAGLGYWLVSRIDPARFAEVFARELGGAHVGADGSRGGFAGRVGLNPVLAGRSLLEVLRFNSFLLCLGMVGIVFTLATVARGTLLLVPWTVVAIGFPLTQVYQPIRYFYPVVPALVILVALMIVQVTRLFPVVEQGRRFMVGTVGLIVAFNLAYLSVSFLANHGNRAGDVARWVEEHVGEDDILVAATHFATNPPNRVYTYDLVAPTPDHLSDAVSELGIRYVIWDAAEWSAAYREVLEERFTLMHEWDYAAIFRVDPATPATPDDSLP